MKFYGYWRSSASWRVRIALHYKGLEFEYAPVHLLQDGGQHHAEAYRALNPMEQVPLLEVEEDGRTVRLAQSLAIIQYLEARFPAPALLPQDLWLRARAWQLAELVNSGIQPLQNLSVMQYVKDQLGGDEKAWTRHWIDRGMTALEASSAETAGRYLVGDSVSIADVCLAPQMYAARRFKLDLTKFPTLVRVEAACMELPAFQAAHADRQPDATPA